MIPNKPDSRPEESVESNKYVCDPKIAIWLAGLFDSSPDSIKNTIEEYFNNLELREDLLVNKTVLDIGSEWAMFDRYAEKKYKSTVATISLDEKWFGDKHQLGAIADARALPFKDDSFDLVVSHASMPHFLFQDNFDNTNSENPQIRERNREQIMKDIFAVFEEAIRVTNPGGQIRMSTISENPWVGKNREHFDKKRLEMLLLIKECIREIEIHMNVQITFKDNQGLHGLIIIRKPK